jgi:hypothetical protein
MRNERACEPDRSDGYVPSKSACLIGGTGSRLSQTFVQERVLSLVFASTLHSSNTPSLHVLSHPCPFRPVSHRVFAYRRRAHGAIQLAFRATSRRDIRLAS